MKDIAEKTQRLLELLGHDEMPFGVHYTEVKPDGFGPKAGEIFSRERECAGQIDWRKVGEKFSCVIGNIWLARKKKKAAWLSHEECGCMGGGFYTGIYGPYLEMNVLFVSTGIPGTPVGGEHYLPSPESMRNFMDDVTPQKASGKYCVFKPLERFADDSPPLVVSFFARPEVLNGLYSLTMYATGDHQSVVTPFAPGCASITSWPLVYQQRGLERAVIGGFDLSVRKFMKTDELTFAVPLSLYRKMLDVMNESALNRHSWEGPRKKVLRSRRFWGEEPGLGDKSA